MKIVYRITEEEYNNTLPERRGVWTTERWDIPGWAEKRKRYMGKRTLRVNLNGMTTLLIEGICLEIVDNKVKTA